MIILRLLSNYLDCLENTNKLRLLDFTYIIYNIYCSYITYQDSFDIIFLCSAFKFGDSNDEHNNMQLEDSHLEDSIGMVTHY